MIKDRNIAWRRKEWAIPATQFAGFAKISGTDIISAGTGAPILKEIGARGHVGVMMDTAGDFVSHRTRVPWDLDPRADVGFTVNWMSGSSDLADTINWKVWWELKRGGVSLTSVLLAELDTQIAQDSVTGADHNQYTSRGVLNGGFISRPDLDAHAGLLIGVEMDAFAAGLTQDKFLLELIVDYKLRMTRR